MEVAFVINNLDGHCLSSLFIPYDEHHVSKDNERVVGVKKKNYIFFEKKTKGIKR